MTDTHNPITAKFSEDTIKYCEGSDMWKIVQDWNTSGKIEFHPKIIYLKQEIESVIPA